LRGILFGFALKKGRGERFGGGSESLGCDREGAVAFFVNDEIDGAGGWW